MIADETPIPSDNEPTGGLIPAANDNAVARSTRMDPRILEIARAIGRFIAREHMRLQDANNDNDQKDEP
jgi:hypothetical protein